MVTPHLPWKFHENWSSRFLVILLTKKQTKKETKKERNRSITILRPPTGGGVITSPPCLVCATAQPWKSWSQLWSCSQIPSPLICTASRSAHQSRTSESHTGDVGRRQLRQRSWSEAARVVVMYCLRVDRSAGSRMNHGDKSYRTTYESCDNCALRAGVNTASCCHNRNVSRPQISACALLCPPIMRRSNIFSEILMKPRRIMIAINTQIARSNSAWYLHSRNCIYLLIE